MAHGNGADEGAHLPFDIFFMIKGICVVTLPVPSTLATGRPRSPTRGSGPGPGLIVPRSFGFAARRPGGENRVPRSGPRSGPGNG